jgi:hypothetical protein
MVGPNAQSAFADAFAEEAIKGKVIDVSEDRKCVLRAPKQRKKGAEAWQETYSCPVFLITRRILFFRANLMPAAISLALVALMA